MSDRGFTLIELLVASAMLLGVMGLVAGLSLPLRDGFERSLGAADMTSGSRTVLDRLAAEVREAGSPAAVGDAPLARVVSPIVPLATLDSSSWADHAQALRLTRVPLSAAQGRLLVGASAGDVNVTLDTTARCTAVGLGCGLQPGISALVYDSTHAQSLTVDAVATGGVVRFAAPLTSPFAAGSVVVGVAVTTYGLRPAADGAFRLIRASSGSELPLIDDVVDFQVRVRGDLFHPRQVDLALRLEAPSSSMRGPAGRLFRRAGTAVRSASWVPDVQITTTVSLRNGVN